MTLISHPNDTRKARPAARRRSQGAKDNRNGTDSLIRSSARHGKRSGWQSRANGDVRPRRPHEMTNELSSKADVAGRWETFAGMRSKIPKITEPLLFSGNRCRKPDQRQQGY